MSDSVSLLISLDIIVLVSILPLAKAHKVDRCLGTIIVLVGKNVLLLIGHNKLNKKWEIF